MAKIRKELKIYNYTKITKVDKYKIMAGMTQKELK